MMRSVPMNRARTLIICTRPGDYMHTRVREAAKHLLAQTNVSEEEKQLAEEALTSLQPPANSQPAAAPAPQRTRAPPARKRR